MRQNKTDNQDGMDMSICRINRTQQGAEVFFSGAKQNLYSTYDGEVKVVKGDRHSVGGMAKRKELSFAITEHYIELPKSAMLYLTSDGYIDQSDQERKRLGSAKFRELVDNYTFECPKQHQNFANALAEHQQNSEQRDDITIMGIRI